MDVTPLDFALRSLVDDAPDAFVATDADGRITHFNRRAEALFGWAEAEACGRTVADTIVPPAFRAAHAAGFARAAASGRLTLPPEPIELCARHRDGREIPIELSLTRLEVDGRPAFAAFIRDITERVTAAEQLDEAESLFRQAFDASPVGCALIDLDTLRLRRVNTALADMLGVGADELLGRSLRDFSHPDDHEGDARVTEALRTAATDGYRSERRYLRPDGEVMWADVSVSLVRDAAGTPRCFIVQTIDTTQRKRAEAALADERSSLARAQAMAHVGSWEWDLDDDVIGWTDELRRIYGLGPGDEPLSFDQVLPLIHPDDLAHTIGAIDAAAADGTAEVEYRIVRPDGSVRWLHGHRVQLEPDARGHRRMAGTTQDVTVRKEIEQALAEARDEAVEASRMKSRFLANMSHEIRTPMHGVIGMLDALLHADLAPAQHRWAQTAHDAANALLVIIDDILDLSKIEAGKLSVERVDFDLARTVEDVVDIFRTQACTRGLDVALRIAPELPATVVGDPVRVRQVLSNLLSNAIKFTESGDEVVVEVAPGGDGAVAFSVIDHGIGIGPAELAQLFEPFTQADASTTRRYGGTGLGLTISRHLAGLMGGELRARSEVGVGSTFTFTAALEPAPRRDDAHAGAAAAAVAAAAAEPAPPAAAGRRVLVAEDNPVNQTVARLSLQRRGLEVDVVDDGRQAVDRLREQAYDLILMDCQMPVMDGFEATAAIRALGGAVAATPIIAMTASSMPEHRERCAAAGMDGFVPKPVRSAELDDVLERWL